MKRNRTMVRNKKQSVIFLVYCMITSSVLYTLSCWVDLGSSQEKNNRWDSSIPTEGSPLEYASAELRIHRGNATAEVVLFLNDGWIAYPSDQKPFKDGELTISPIAASISLEENLSINIAGDFKLANPNQAIRKLSIGENELHVLHGKIKWTVPNTVRRGFCGSFSEVVGCGFGPSYFGELQAAKTLATWRQELTAGYVGDRAA